MVPATREPKGLRPTLPAPSIEGASARRGAPTTLMMGVRPLALVVAGLLLAILALGGSGAGAAEANEVQAGAEATPLFARARSDLRKFTSWLAVGGKTGQGMIGEVGWPGDARAGGDRRWNELARAWYREALDAKLSVAAWATGEFWAPSYKLLAYRASASAINADNAQAAVIEGQPASRLRGLNVAGAEFATPVDEPSSPFSNANAGLYGRDYLYPSQESLAYLAARGISFVRLPLRWERLQPRLGHALDRDEQRRLLSCVARARAAGLEVVLDVHNYGAYYLFSPSRDEGVRRAVGSRHVSNAHFANLWLQLSRMFKRNATVVGYGLMNEPVGMRGARAWESASRAAVRAVRSNGDGKRILVQSYFWGGVRQFHAYHPGGPWIKDPNTWYEAHQYFDSDRSARYAATFDEEVVLAAKEGF